MPDRHLPETLPAETMHQALHIGSAQPLSPLNRDLARYRDRWWFAEDAGWRRVDDAELHARLDEAAASLHRWHQPDGGGGEG